MENNTTVNEKKDPAKKKKRGNFVLRLIQGAIVGVGGIIPGISGGVLCAVFGFYEPLMEVLAHPIKGLKKHFKLILPVVIGIGTGFVALAKVVEIMFKSNEAIATALFVGLILGEMPSLFKEASEQERKGRSSYVSMAVAFAVLFTAFMILELGTEMTITPNAFWYVVSGLFLGLGVVIPGMSGSAPLTFLGLYGPLMGVISAVGEGGIGFVSGKLSFATAIQVMNLDAVIPVGIGILIPFLVISRPIHYCLKKFPSQMYHAIFGIVAATTIPTLMFKIGWTDMPLIKLGFVVLGFVGAWLIDLLSRKYAA